MSTFTKLFSLLIITIGSSLIKDQVDCQVYHRRGYQRILTPPDYSPQYVHSYAVDNYGRYDARSWINGNPAQSSYGHQSMAPSNYANQPQISRRRSTPNGDYIEESVPVIVPPSSQWSNAVNQLVHYVKTPEFLQKVNTLASQSEFKRTVTGNWSKDDLKILESNIERKDLGFSKIDGDCVPMLTNVKFGDMNRPEVMYSPSSIALKRCPQGCFSWQFDCLPVRKAIHNFTVAIYTVSPGRNQRDVKTLSIESHEECICSCKSLAACFNQPDFPAQRYMP